MAGRGRGPKVTHWLRLILRMPWRRKVEFIVVLSLAAASEVTIRMLTLPRAARLFAVRLDSGGEPQVAPECSSTATLPPWAVRRLAVVQAVMRHWPIDGVCLRESLVAGQRIRRLDPVMKVGVRRGTDGVTAHAWLQVGGVDLDPSAIKFGELVLDGR
jgi:hypothetical protein